MMPKEWRIACLGDITTKIGDGIHSTPKYSANSSIYFINGNNFKNGKIVVQGSSKCVDKVDAQRHYRELTDRTILMSINGTIGNLACYSGESVVLGKSACYINVDANNDVDFVFYTLASPKVLAFYWAELTGSTIKNLSLRTVKSTKLELPPLPEQKRIAAILSSVDDAIAATEAVVEQTQRVKEGLLQDLLTRGIGHTRFKQTEIGEIPEGWERCFLKDGASLISGQHVDAKFVNENQDGKPYLTGPSDFPKGKIITSKYTNSGNKFCESGDILITVKGSGTGKMISADGEYAISRQLMAIRATEFDSKFLYYSLLAATKRYQAASAGLIPGISRDDVLNTPLVRPALSEQKRIAAIVSSIDDVIAKNQDKLMQAQCAKRGLMQDLLSGDVRVAV